jgi:hypothetical protein
VPPLAVRVTGVDAVLTVMGASVEAVVMLNPPVEGLSPSPHPAIIVKMARNRK